MSREKILEYFKDINHAYNDCTRYDTLKHMLDELQEPCEDAISRQAAIDELYKMLHDCFGADDEELDAVITTLNALPPVTPAEKPSKWIPVSERLPEENGQYLITVKYKHVNDSYEDVYAEHGEWYDGNWDMLCFGHCGQVETILAWMPLPEPYKEG